jgi:hypothetical protein
VVVGNGYGKNRDTTRNHEGKDKDRSGKEEMKPGTKKMWVGGRARDREGKGQNQERKKDDGFAGIRGTAGRNPRNDRPEQKHS